jgi:DNA repair exonuclease SbcCD ATPase subunit
VLLNKNIVDIETNENNKQFNDNIDMEIRLLKEKLNETNKIINGILSKLGIIKERIGDIEIQIKTLQIDLEELNTLDNKVKNYNILANAFDKKGIILTVISDNLQYIEDRVNNIISTYIDKKLRLTHHIENINLTFLSNDLARPIRLLGGMETFIVDLAFKIIFSEISQISSSSILFIDEGISVLDKEKISNFDNMVSFLEKHFNKTFLITHIDTIQDFVSNKLDITKTNEYSHVNNTKHTFTEENTITENTVTKKTKNIVPKKTKKTTKIKNNNI